MTCVRCCACDRGRTDAHARGAAQLVGREVLGRHDVVAEAAQQRAVGQLNKVPPNHVDRWWRRRWDGFGSNLVHAVGDALGADGVRARVAARLAAARHRAVGHVAAPAPRRAPAPGIATVWGGALVPKVRLHSHVPASRRARGRWSARGDAAHLRLARAVVARVALATVAVALTGHSMVLCTQRGRLSL